MAKIEKDNRQQTKDRIRPRQNHIAQKKEGNWIGIANLYLLS